MQKSSFPSTKKSEVFIKTFMFIIVAGLFCNGVYTMQDSDGNKSTLLSHKKDRSAKASVHE